MLLLIALTTTASSAAFATDVCTLARYFNDPAGATVNVVCTNTADSKVLSRAGKGSDYVWLGQAYATMKNEAVKTLLEAGYKPVDAETYFR